MTAVICAGISSCLNDTQELQEQHMPAPEAALATKITGSIMAEPCPGNLLLFLEKETSDRIKAGENICEELFGGTSVMSLEPALRHKPKNERLAQELGLDRWYVATFSKDIPVRKVALEIAGCPQICAIQYNSRVKPASDCISSPYVPAAKLKASAVGEHIHYDDPYNSDQWNLLNTGDKGIAETAREGADAGVKDAWFLTGGSPEVIVAVCDAPIKYTHPDLKDAMWTNTAELNGREGVDDDRNGYIDDIHGYNFYSEGYSRGKINWNVDGESGHGTHVAGIIGATNNNGIGISSIAGGTGNGDGVRLMCCQIFEGSVTGGDRDAANAIMYAADNGACILQCSYGYDAPLYNSDNAYINAAPLEYRALKYFVDPENSNHPSIGSNLAIFAAGNESMTNSDYPGALPMCVSVTAFGPDFLPAGYTNYGRGCNIAAPGGDLWAGNPNESENRSRILSTCISEVASEYAWMQGSSMACPHVSGVAALGVSYAEKLGKRFSGNEFRDMLLTAVNDINCFLNSGTKPYGNSYSINLKAYQKRMGTGATDAWKLLMQIEGIPSITVRYGATCKVDLSEYFGDGADGLTYLGVTVSDDAMETLGMDSVPTIDKGIMSIKCGKNGSAKITVSAIAGGGQLGGGNNIGGTEIVKEVAIVSRGVYSENGGWL